MKRCGLWCLIPFAAALLGGCEEKRVQAPTPVAPEIKQANPRLPVMKLWMGAAEINAELALNDTQRMTGMMFRTNIAETEGMLFVFPRPHRTAFWMKNTSVPMSAAYIDPEGVIREIHELQPYNTNSVEAASNNIQYVLETSRGWFERNHIGVGTAIRTELGTMAGTFRPGN